MVWCTRANRSSGSSSPSGSATFRPETSLPSWPSPLSPRRLTGTKANISSAPGWPPRRRRSRSSAPATAVRTTSLTEPPSASLTALTWSRDSRCHANERSGPTGCVVGRVGRGAQGRAGQAGHPGGALDHRARGPARVGHGAGHGAQRLGRQRALDHRLGQHPHRRRGRLGLQRARLHVVAAVGIGGEQGLEHLHAGDPVDQRVVHLVQQREAPALEALDHLDLPRRPVVVHRLGHQVREQRLHALRRPRARPGPRARRDPPAGSPRRRPSAGGRGPAARARGAGGSWAPPRGTGPAPRAPRSCSGAGPANTSAPPTHMFESSSSSDRNVASRALRRFFSIASPSSGWGMKYPGAPPATLAR